MKNSLWIARDKIGEAFLYNEEPQRNGDEFFPRRGSICKMVPNYIDVFEDLTWENSPQLLNLTNKN